MVVDSETLKGKEIDLLSCTNEAVTDSEVRSSCIPGLFSFHLYSAQSKFNFVSCFLSSIKFRYNEIT